jgi:hypothetical protein
MLHVVKALGISMGSVGAIFAALKYSGQLDPYQPDKDRRRARQQLIREQIEREELEEASRLIKEKSEAAAFVRTHIADESGDDSWAVVHSKDRYLAKANVTYVFGASNILLQAFGLQSFLAGPSMRFLSNPIGKETLVESKKQALLHNIAVGRHT